MYDTFIMGLIMCLVPIAGVIGYCCGRADKAQLLKQAELKTDAEIEVGKVIKKELDTTRRVQHNLNCLVGDLKFEVSQLKPDALAYNQSKGLWCTDQPDLIKFHAKKERFFRLGYPEQSL